MFDTINRFDSIRFFETDRSSSLSASFDYQSSYENSPFPYHCSTLGIISRSSVMSILSVNICVVIIIIVR